MKSSLQMNLSGNSLDHELSILLSCVGGELSLPKPGTQNNVIKSNADWQSVIRYTQHHRLIPPVYNHLRKYYSETVPGEVLAQLKNLNDNVVKQSLAQAAELKRILPALKKNNIDVAILKGRALAEKLYGNIALRQSRDIDLLVRQQDVIQTDSILHDLGYHISNLRSGLPLNSALGRKLIKSRSELDYLSRQHDVCVDLHWHLSHSRHAFPVDMNELWLQMNYEQTEFGRTGELPTSMHFIFLCYHGAKHHWLRLHWLLDIAILIKGGGLDWPHILSTAKKLGVLPTITLAVILANYFYKIAIPDPVKQDTRQFGEGYKLARLMIKDMVRSPVDIDNNVAPYMDFKRIKTGYRLQTILKHRFLTWTDLLFPSDTDYQSIKLPARLSYFYYVVRCFRLLQKLVTRISHSMTHRDATATQ